MEFRTGGRFFLPGGCLLIGDSSRRISGQQRGRSGASRLPSTQPGLPVSVTLGTTA